eukprot:232360-Alexandrium_andersonii.AAC.1
MSASLVGSEMCIRDRLPSSAPVCSDTGTAKSYTHVAQWYYSERCAHCVPCLLYTSDAADDM